jgi:hypothetical protein
VNAVRHHRPIPPSKFAPGITRPVVALIMRMIEKSPSRRHRDMGEVILDIDRIEATVSGDANEARGLRAWLRRIFEEPPSGR